MAVMELFVGQVIAQRQRFEEDRTARIRGQFQVKKNRRRTGDLIRKAAADAQGNVEVGRDVMR
jgi:hypothetical protein